MGKNQFWQYGAGAHYHFEQDQHLAPISTTKCFKRKKKIKKWPKVVEAYFCKVKRLNLQELITTG